jgi:hypothetical protein
MRTKKRKNTKTTKSQKKHPEYLKLLALLGVLIVGFVVTYFVNNALNSSLTYKSSAKEISATSPMVNGQVVRWNIQYYQPYPPYPVAFESMYADINAVNRNYLTKRPPAGVVPNRQYYVNFVSDPMYIPAGTYQVTFNRDDEVWYYIDDVQVYHAGCCGQQVVPITIAQSGNHTIRAYYREDGASSAFINITWPQLPPAPTPTPVNE